MFKIINPYPHKIIGGSGLFSINNLQRGIDFGSVKYSTLTVNIYYDCYLLKTKFGLAVFDNKLRPIDLSIPKRGWLGKEKPSAVFKSINNVALVKMNDDNPLLNGQKNKWLNFECLSSVRGKLDTPEVGSLLYLSAIHNQFGHAITEGLARFWPLLYETPHKFDYIYNGGKSRSSHIAEVFWDSFGYKNIFNAKDYAKHFSSDQGVKVREIYIPEPGMYLGGKYNAQMFDVWERVSKYCNSNIKNTNNIDCIGEKVYFSRSGVSKRKCLDEGLIESFFEKKGFNIIKPETLNFCEQVSLIKQSAVIAGLSGSAMHLCQFFQRRKIILLTPSFHVMADMLPIAEINNSDILFFLSAAEYVNEDNSFFFFDNVCTLDLLNYHVDKFINQNS